MKTIEEIKNFVQEEKTKQAQASRGHEDAQMLKAIRVAELTLTTATTPNQFLAQMRQERKNIMFLRDTPDQVQYRIAIDYFIHHANS